MNKNGEKSLPSSGLEVSKSSCREQPSIAVAINVVALRIIRHPTLSSQYQGPSGAGAHQKDTIDFDSHELSHHRVERSKPEIRISFADRFAIVEEWVDD
jgi:hypothetical protein